MFYATYRTKGEDKWRQWQNPVAFKSEADAISVIKEWYVRLTGIISENYDEINKIYTVVFQLISSKAHQTREHGIFDCPTNQFNIFLSYREEDETTWKSFTWDQLGTFNSHLDAIRSIDAEFAHYRSAIIDRSYDQETYRLEVIEGNFPKKLFYEFAFQKTDVFRMRSLPERSKSTWDIIKLSGES